MNLSEVSSILSEIKTLVENINSFVPAGRPRNNTFRSDLSGLLIVSLAALYENCVKEIIVSYTESHHPAFGRYAEKQYEKLNSKIDLNDLYGYASKLDGGIKIKFNHELLKAERRITLNVPCDRDGNPNYMKFTIVKQYKELLQLRHAFAHARQRTTTMEDAVKLHKKGRFVILAFARALS